MTDAAQRAIDAAFRVHGKPATYTPPGGSTDDITVIPRQPDEISLSFGVSTLSESSIFDIRVSEVANAVSDAVIHYGGVDHKIKGKPARNDDLRRVWTCITT